MNLNTLTPYFKVIADAQSRALDGTCHVIRGLAPTANGSGLRVDVAAGDSIEGGTPHYGYAGGNVTCSAASATLYRRDLVSRNSAGTLTLTAGTAAALTSTTPVPPALPASSTLIAVIFIAPLQTLLTATDVEDCRQIRSGDPTALNVKVFGATGDGVTDDTAAVQAAITAVPSAGGTVFFPPGTYLLSRGAGAYCVNLVANVTLLGAGPNASVLKLANSQATSTRLVSATGVNNIRIQALGFDGNKANQAADVAGMQSHILFFDHCNSIQVEGNFFTNASGDTMQFYSLGGTNNPCDGIQVTGNKIINNRRQGVTLDGVTNVLVSSNVFEAMGFAAVDVEPDTAAFVTRDIAIVGNVVTGWVGNATSGGAITVTGQPSVDSENFRRVTIANNVLDGNGTSTVNGIEIGAWGEFSITGNLIRQPGLYGIQCRAGRGTISNNELRDLPLNGIACAAYPAGIISTSRLTVTGNLIEHFGTSVANPGIQFSDVTDSTISGNVVYDAPAGTFGINIIGASARNVISGNVVDNPGAVGGGGAAINEANTSNNNTITANYVANYSNAILFVGAATIISGNKGYNPRGSVTAPAFPASTVAATNTTGGWITAYIANGANAITVVAVNAVTTGLQIAVNGWGSVRCGPGQTMTFTYGGGAPTWTWFGD